MTQPQPINWKRMLKRAGPYPPEAFQFVREGLSYTAQKMHPDLDAISDEERHISGQVLSLGLRDFAIEQYGLLAPAVLNHWFIKRTDDFGRIVYAMIDEELMSQGANDTIEDFRGVFDFLEAFGREELLARLASEKN